MRKKSVIVLEPEYYSEKSKNRLQSQGLECVLKSCKTRQDLIEAISNLRKANEPAAAIFTTLGIGLDETVFKTGGEELRWIVTPTTGLDHIDLEKAECYGIKVLSLKGQIKFLKQITPTAELVFGLLLSLLRHIPAANNDVMKGNWRRELFLGREIKEMSMGIIGLGRLGTMVSSYAKSFGMQVLACDEKEEPFHDCVNSHVKRKYSIIELLDESDVVSLHLPLEERNVGIIGEKEFKHFKKGAYLINTARGELIDEDALLKALEKGVLGGCAVDVLCGDSQWEADVPQDHPLINYARDNSNLVITPHIGGYAIDAIMKTRAFMVGQFLKAFSA